MYKKLLAKGSVLSKSSIIAIIIIVSITARIIAIQFFPAPVRLFMVLAQYLLKESQVSQNFSNHINHAKPVS